MNNTTKTPAKTPAKTAQKSATPAKKSAPTSKSSNMTGGDKGNMNARATNNQSCHSEYAEDMCKLTDKDIISDVLGSQKSLITLYSTALCESSCKNMRELVNTKLCESATDQYDMFLYMNERGMYPTEPAPAQKVQQAKQMYAGKCTQMKK